jgi:hypothetical protein
MNVTVPPPETIYTFRATVTTSRASVAALAAAYQTSNAYVVGDVFGNAGILYGVIKAGTSGTTAPTGTGASITDAVGGAGAPVYRALVSIQRVTVRNLDASPATAVDVGNSSVTAGGGMPVYGGELLAQGIANPANLYLIAGGSVSVAIGVE